MRHAWIELLHIVKEKRPKSIQELARLTKRDIKSSGTDIGILVSYKNILTLPRFYEDKFSKNLRITNYDLRLRKS